ncbi:filamentous hemagglutinin outer membrane protein [Nostoc commune NIES-4072]|uniref:Filamentous hemagglutinin outer membrane protein n=2 Tax=Nostoc commune TaxID=1178 RepID=A0A2R5FJK6_NOSCO|nr:filamentous hemagglutinin outer membrane protein [Nostoc commune HK-02]GBG18937.1 filamentous hemagglutinin outer membrane protein [Nostoc commune NIES-4072]
MLALLSCIAPCPAKAQITPDATLGDKSSVVVPDTFKGSPIDRINGGAIQGANLFHSFQEFNVVEKGAYFTNPGGITNILTRVTGGNASNILGTLGVLGPANLFLINPNGIVFGPNARLDMGGSFVASTADSLVFDNGLEFSATNPQAPLLTVNIPVGLRFRDASGKIINRSQATVDGVEIGLQIPPQKTLALIGGNVDLEGGWLIGPDVQIEIASVGDSSLVNFINSDTGYNFDYSGVENFQDILLSDQAIVNINGNGSGSIRMQGRNVTLNDESRLFADNLGSSGREVLIQAEQLTLDNASISADVRGLGQGRNITIETQNLLVQNGARISTATFGGGNGGTVKITATDSVVIQGESQSQQGFFSGVQSVAAGGASGDAGGVEINTASFLLKDGARLDTTTFGGGKGGTVKINATDSVVIQGESQSQQGFFSGVLSLVAGGASGDAGGIEINTASFLLKDGARLDTTTSGGGKGGTVKINATDSVVIQGESNRQERLSGIQSLVRGGASGDAGGVEINTASFLLKDGARLDTTTFGDGNGGTVKINATDSVVIQGESQSQQGFFSGVLSLVAGGASGDAGGVEINTASFLLKDGARLDTTTFGGGKGGTVKITATDSVVIQGESQQNSFSGVLSLAAGGPSGDAGGIEINTASFLLKDGNRLSTTTFGDGNGGTVKINATDSVVMEGESRRQERLSGIESVVGGGASGDAGGIEINTADLSLKDGAFLTASTSGTGNAGKVTINATESVMFEGKFIQEKFGLGVGGVSTIVESGALGNAGAIDIDTTSLILRDGAFLATSTFGESDAGNITVTTNTFEITSGGRLLSTTRGNRAAGNIFLQIEDSISLAGENSGIFANTEAGSTGRGGNIFMDTQTTVIQDGAKLSVNSQGSGVGGDISLQANSLTLDRGTISAETAKERGGNIRLDVADLLLMSDESKITTSAGLQSQPGAIGTGGNIKIDTQFLVASPSKPKGSDITANATYGNGGRVDITATGIFGIEFRDKPRDFLNDITASSEFGGNPGVVNINQVIDPSQNLVELPANVIDPNDQIAQNPCSKGVASEFTIAGRGGLPPSPNEDLSQEATQVDLVDPVSTVSNVKLPQKTSSSHNLKSQIPSPIVPAQGWVFNNKGEVVLTAYNSNVIGIHRLPKNLNSCPAR